MKWVEYRLYILLLIISPVLSEILTASLIAGAIGIGGASVGYYYDEIKKKSWCKIDANECCYSDFIPHDLLSLQNSLTSNLFGQHIIEEKLFKAIASHYKNVDKSKKPLVMTFHGTQGTGKNFVASMIVKAVFKKGTKSKYHHFFKGSEYPDKERIFEHKESIKNTIFDAIDKCPFSIFVFDEVDKMHAGIFDSITGLLDHHSLIKGKDFKKSMFIFLTNSGGEEMTNVLQKLINSNGLYRHETKLHHFEEIMKVSVFNKEGGLKESSLIKSAVIDFYFPFLPLEEKHISQCIVEEFRDCGKTDISEGMIKEIIRHIGFNRNTKYAHTGCKGINKKVETECYS